MRWLLVTLLLVLQAPGASADALPAQTGLLVDPTHAIRRARAAWIEADLQDVARRSGVKIVVAVVPSTARERVESYASALFDRWGLAQVGGESVLLVAAVSQRAVAIHVGDGLAASINDADTAALLDEVSPLVRAGDVASAVERAEGGLAELLGAAPGHAASTRGITLDGSTNDRAPAPGAVPVNNRGFTGKRILLLTGAVVLTILLRLEMTGRVRARKRPKSS